MQRLTRRLATVLSSRRFTIGVLVFFAFEGLWIACSAVYPMAFDEEFHFGLIDIYSHRWLPFFGAQPPGLGRFGAFASDPSYLYHYLMSFPYRLLHIFVHDQTVLVIMLRFVNVGLFALGLVLFYKLLRLVGTSRLLANTALALFVLIPIVPLLAAHINYDNLLFVVTAWTCLLAVRLHAGLVARKIDLRSWAVLGIVLLLSSLVKYAFLPIALAVALFLGVSAVRSFWRRGAAFKKALAFGYGSVGRRARVTLAVLLLLSASLFVQRYGTNIVAYHSPVPECDAVLSVDECLDYGPWERNYRFAHTKPDFDDSALQYARTWVNGMYYRLFFMVAGVTNGYASSPPMLLPARAAAVIGVAAGLALLWQWRKVFAGSSTLVFLLLVPATYCLVLWLNGYQDLLNTGRPVAINGRYLLIILFPLIAVFGRALSLGLRRWPVLHPWLATAAIVLFLQGGGVCSFILRSDARWYWPSPLVVHANNALRSILDPVTYEGNVPPLERR